MSDLVLSRREVAELRRTPPARPPKNNALTWPAGWADARLRDEALAQQ